MFYCTECGEITEGTERTQSVLPEIPGAQPGAWSQYVTCSACGSEYIEAAIMCPRCNTWHKHEGSSLCEDCRAEIRYSYIQTFKKYFDAGVNKYDLLDAMNDEFEVFYNEKV